MVGEGHRVWLEGMFKYVEHFCVQHVKKICDDLPEDKHLNAILPLLASEFYKSFYIPVQEISSIVVRVNISQMEHLIYMRNQPKNDVIVVESKLNGD